MKMPVFICARLLMVVLMIGTVGCGGTTARTIDRIGSRVSMADNDIPTEEIRR